MKKYYSQILFLIMLSLVFVGCDKGGTAPAPPPPPAPEYRSIELKDIWPRRLPSVSRDSFSVTVAAHELSQGVYVHIEIRSHSNTSCLAFADSTLFITQITPSGTKWINTDSLQSSCVAQNSVFKIVVWFRDTLNIIRRDSAYYQWGNAPTTGNTLTAEIEPWRMSYVSSALADTMNKCTIRTLNPSDSNFIKCTATFDNIQSASDTDFMVSSRTDLTSICNWWSRNHYITPFHNKVIYARFESVELGLVGWSQCNGYFPINEIEKNWSYTFYKNIDSLCPPGGTRNDTTIGNLVSAHEIMHQLANSFNDRAHNMHYGYFFYKCVLWDSTAHFIDEIQNHKYTNKFRVCINHTMQLRSFRQVIPLDNTGGNVIYTRFIAPNPWLESAGISKNGDKYSIALSLPKQEYRKYEPVIAKLVLTNHDSKPLDIYNLHNDFSGEPHFVIKDAYGNTYESKNFEGFFLPYYTTTLLPGDSLIFSMTMNNWGKATSYKKTLSLDEVYFDQFGYFPEGDYKTVFHCNLNGEEIHSDEVNFKVIDLTPEDQEVLHLYKQKHYDEVLTRFPNNVFTEHVHMWKMLPYWNTITDNTENDYNNFIQKYPASMYLLSWRFMLPYVKSAEQKEHNYQRGIDYLLSLQRQESLARQSLSNEPFTTIIKNYGKVIEKIK